MISRQPLRTRPWRARGALGLVAALAAAAPEAAVAEALALRGGTLHTIANGVVSPGTLVVRDGRIAAVGPDAEVEVPEDALVRDLVGAVVIPGLVDTHSHIGIAPRPRVPAHGDTNELSDPRQSGARAIDGISPQDPGIRMATAGGVTTANIMPGSGNVIGGQTAYVKLRGETIEAMLVEPRGVVGGLKMANGENPKRSYGGRGKAPATRMAVASLQRDAFVSARAYREKWRAYRDDGDGEPPERDLALEPLVEVLEGRRTVHFHTHRADDIATALRLAREFGFELVLQHATEAYRLADEIAAHGAAASIILLDSPGGKHEVSALRFDNGAALERAGVRVAIHTDDPITPSRLLLRSAALAVRGGMSEAAALRAVTLEAAALLHLDHRLGSLEVGKDADFVVLSGPPLSVYTHVLETWIDGARVFDRADPRQRRYATGGYGLADRYPDPQGAP